MKGSKILSVELSTVRLHQYYSLFMPNKLQYTWRGHYCECVRPVQLLVLSDVWAPSILEQHPRYVPHWDRAGYNRLTDWLSDRLTGWLPNWPANWPVDWVTDRLTELLTAKLNGWLTGWLVDWLFGWLPDTLTERLADGPADLKFLMNLLSSFTNKCTFIKILIKIYIKIRWLLHVSVYDHHQGAWYWAWLKLYWY